MQKTAYVVRISDCSSVVCSSDLRRWLIYTIDIDCHRVLTAWITIGCSDSTDIRGRIIGLPVDDQPWHCELQRGGSCHSCRCGLCTCDRAARYRHILQSLLATLRCDDDISDRSIIPRSVGGGGDVRHRRSNLPSGSASCR